MPPEREDGSSPSEIETGNVEATAAAAAEAEQASADAKAADSSAAGDAKPEPTMLDAVTAALENGGEDGGSSDPEGKPAAKVEAEDAADGEKPKDGGDEAKDEAEEDLPFHKHPAWIRQREKLTAATAEVDALKPKAEQYDRMMGFIEERQLEVPEVNAGFEIMALMKHDPAAALEKLRPYYDALQQMVGEVLPDDLAEQVRLGEITEDRAKELVVLRSSKAQSEAAQKRTAEQDAAQKAQAVQAAIGTAVAGWESEWAGSDPDYPKLKSLVRDRAAALMRDQQMQGKPLPSTPEEAVAVLKDAQAQIRKEAGSLAPKPKPINGPVDSDGSAKATAEPNSTLDAINLGIERAAKAA